MVAFVITAFILTVAVLLVLFLGARLHGEDSGESARIGTNLEALRAEFAKAQSDRAAGRIGEEEFEEVKGELERRVLEETRRTESVAGDDRKQRLGTFAFLAVFIPLAAAVIYWRFGTWDALNPDIVAMQSHTQGGHSMEEIDQQLASLEKKLAENPEDVNGWMLLARTNDALKRFDKAAAAYEKLAGLVQGKARAQVLADWADCLAMIEGGISGKPEQLVDEAIKLDPHLWKALALKGTALYNRNDFKGAARVWERLLADQQPGSDEWSSVAGMVNDAREKAGMPLISAPAGMKRMEQDGQAGKPDAAAPQARVSGTVSVSPDLAGKLTGSETVFVFARPVEGPKMPVALAQFKASELPREFVLDSSMTMPGGGMGGLDSLDRVVVGARISKSGNLMPQPGDLEGLTPAVAVGSSSLVLKVTRVIGN